MRTGEETPSNPESVQAFWPGVQVLVGDVASANSTHRDFYMLWRRNGVLPDKFIDDNFPVLSFPISEYFSFYGKYSLFPDWPMMKLNRLHPTERRYPLRPELIESTFYLYQATKDPWYFKVGEEIMESLIGYSKVCGGFASVKDVITMTLEDHQPGYFLSETLKYLYLLFDDSFLDNDNYIFTTKGHPLPVMSPVDHERNIRDSGRGYFVDNLLAFIIQKLEKVKKPSSLSAQVCPSTTSTAEDYITGIGSACHVLDAFPDHNCSTHEDCGVDLSSCIPRECSSKGYCGDGYFDRHMNNILVTKRVMELFLGTETMDKTKNKTMIHSLLESVGHFGRSFFSC